MAKRRMTRKHYNRKLIVFGAMLLMAISLISIGFASWVVSLGANQKDVGNVNVAVVEDRSVKVTDAAGKIESETGCDFIYETDNSFRFGPQVTDTTGSFYYDATQLNADYEQLTLTLKGRIYDVDNVTSFGIKLDVPQGVRQAAQEGWIVLPDAANSEVTVTAAQIAGTAPEGFTFVDKGDYTEFSYVLSFKWGTKFYLTEGRDDFGITTEELTSLDNSAKNPWLWCEDALAKCDTYDQKVLFGEWAKSRITEFRSVVYGLDASEGNKSYESIPNANKQFTVTITARTNAN